MVYLAVLADALRTGQGAFVHQVVDANLAAVINWHLIALPGAVRGYTLPVVLKIVGYIFLPGPQAVGITVKEVAYALAAGFPIA